MNRSQIATAIALRELCCCSINTIEDRVLLQTKIFLAQDIGLPLGYGYSWYIYGPYSADLTAVAYQVIAEGGESTGEKCFCFREPYANMIKRVNDLESEIKAHKLKIGVAQWYELVAIVAYWYKRGNKAESTIVKKIKQTKPLFTEEQTKAAFASYVALKGGV